MSRHQAPPLARHAANDQAGIHWRLPLQRLMKYFKGGNEEEKAFDVTTPTLA